MHHAGTALGACALAFVIAWLWETFAPEAENVTAKMDRTAVLGSVFYGLHVTHLLFSAATFVLVYRSISEGRARWVLPLGIVVSLLVCTLNDIIFPYTGALIIGVDSIALHVCLLEHPLLVAAPAAIGAVVGTLMARRRFYPTRVTHGGHVLASSMASLIYLTAFSNLTIRGNPAAIAVLVVVTMILHCTLSDLVLPALLARKHRQGGAGGRSIWTAMNVRLKVFMVALAALAVVFAANHAEYALRRQKMAAASKKRNTVVVRVEDDKSGHSTIGIVENALGDESGAFLLFSTLGEWAFDRRSPSACPENIRSLGGGRFKCIGFMYPLETGKNIRLFCLLRTTQTCCYGPRPEYNQYIFVEMDEPVRFERLNPVIVEGAFFVDPRPEDGYIYRMEGSSITTVKDDVPDVDPEAAAKEAGLPMFDFASLEKMRGGGAVPKQLAGLDGKTVVISGFAVGRVREDPPAVIVGREYWDGLSQGTPPDLYNAVTVFPRDADEIPPAWKQNTVFTGVLRVTANAAKYRDAGIATVTDAVRGVPGPGGLRGVVDRGPIIGVEREIAVFALFLLAAFAALCMPRWLREAFPDGGPVE